MIRVLDEWGAPPSSITITECVPKLVLEAVVPVQPLSYLSSAQKNGVRYTRPKQRLYTRHARTWLGAARRAWESAAGRQWPLDARYLVVIDAYRSSAHRVDWDNLGKLVCDAANGVLWKDDVQIVDGRVRKHVDRTRPRLELVVEVIQ